MLHVIYFDSLRPAASTHYPTIITNLTTCLRLLITLVSFSVDYDQYLRSRTPTKQQQARPPSHALVKFTRWSVIHDILMLPDHGNDTNPEQIVYEICRLMMLAYTLFVLAPITSRSEPSVKLANKFRHILTVDRNDGSKDAIRFRHPDLFLSAAIWGGMCAQRGANTSSELVETFIDFLDSGTVKVEKHAWPIAAGIMKSYIWLEADCDEAGRKFWMTACSRSLKVKLMQPCQEKEGIGQSRNNNA